MPSRELPITPIAPYGVSPGLLKRHKTLPRPQEDALSNVYRTRLTPKPRVLTVDTGIPSSPSSQTSSPPTLKHASKRIGVPELPPTPPAHSRQSSRGNAAPVAVAISESVKTSLPTTPTNHQSPPTPDVTPPKMASRSRPSISRPPTSERYPSSRTDSFKTAREHPYSSDEDEQSTVRPFPPSAGPLRTDVPQIQSRSLKKIRDIGLGLGLESENDLTPSPRQPSQDRGYFHNNEMDDFGTFDGEWSSTAGEITEVEREWDDNLQRNVTVRRRPARKPYNFTDSPSAEVLDDNPVTPTNATRLLREYPMLESFGNSPLQTLSGDVTPTDKYRPPAIWPTLKDLEEPSTPDVRRFSTLSARSNNSAVIEVMVVEAPPTRRKTLRHTKKQSGLRDFSSDQSTQGSTVGSTISSEAPHRLLHKSSGMFQRNQRHRSLGSTTASTTSSAKSRKEIWSSGSIPVVVVPERRSSTKSSHPPSLRSTSSRRTKRSMSLNSAPLSNSSKTNEPGYFDIPRHKPRRLSESAGSSGSQRTIDFPPTIPVRRSSLSAPTSRNVSRAGSLTAESLKAHNMNQLEDQKLHNMQKPQLSSESSQKEPGTHLSSRLSVDNNGDPFFGLRLSTHVTPLSTVSHETAGTFQEISEAQAMALYPHQNKSVLIVEHATSPQTSRGSTDTAKPPTVIVNDKPTQEPTTPPQPIHVTDEMDSPLKNPRDPPMPPALKFVPPTPAVLTPGTEEQRRLGYDLVDIPPAETPKPKRGLSLIRRALNNRRFSESGIGRSFSTKRRELADDSTQTEKGSANALYPSVTDQPKDDSKLHPFWRPARFWDDLEDDDYDDEYLTRDAYPPIDNRPGPPKRSLSGSLKRTFAILPIRDDPEFPYWTERRTVRRTGSGNLRVVKNRGSNDSLRRMASNSRPYTSPGYTADAGRFQVQWVGLKTLSRRLSEKRREKRNDKLRSMISGPRDAIDGVARVIGNDSMGRRRDPHGSQAPSVLSRPEWPDQAPQS